MRIFRRWLLLFLLLSGCVLGCRPPAHAGEPPAEAPKPWLERDNLLPDPGGLRERLAKKGIVFSAIYTAEEFGNPVGGRRQGQVYDGLAAAGLDVDFQKLLGDGAGDVWKGLQFHALAYDIHGASGTQKYVRDLGVFSNIDFYDSLRLFELWLDKSFFDGRVSLRLGQLAADAEFATTDPGSLFINADFGALPTFALNLPTPVYAIATPGVRVRLSSPGEKFYFQAAAFDGNPAPDRLGDPSPGFRRGTAYNDSGTRINLNAKEGAFVIGQFGYRLNREPGAKGLPGTYRVGAFYHTDTFSDNRLDRFGRSLADPRSGGVAKARAGDYGGYLAADQNVFVAPGATPISGPAGTPGSAPVGNVEDQPGNPSGAPPTTTSGLAVALFLRLAAAPADRNLSPFYAEAGCSVRGLLPGRPADVFGVAFAHLGVSDSLRRLARDRARFTGGRPGPLPDHENVLEITYQANLTPWLQLQPDLQYIAHPGGSGVFGDALVIGLRSVVTF